MRATILLSGILAIALGPSAANAKLNSCSDPIVIGTTISQTGPLASLTTNWDKMTAAFVDEVNRHDPSVQNTRRFVAEPTLVQGRPLKPGDTVLLVLAAANRDSAWNPDGETFDLENVSRHPYVLETLHATNLAGELKRVGFPLRKVVAMVWGAAEADVEAAGGWALAEGYNAMQFAGVGSDYPVLNEIRALYKKEGQEPPKEMNSTVYYNRGVLIAALHVEAIRNAVKMKKSGNITGEDAKKGFEQIANFTLGGLVPPLKITPQDHEGGGVVQIFQVKGGKFVKATDWFSAYPDVVAKHIKDSAKK